MGSIPPSYIPYTYQLHITKNPSSMCIYIYHHIYSLIYIYTCIHIYIYTSLSLSLQKRNGHDFPTDFPTAPLSVVLRQQLHHPRGSGSGQDFEGSDHRLGLGSSPGRLISIHPSIHPSIYLSIYLSMLSVLSIIFYYILLYFIIFYDSIGYATDIIYI